MIRAVLWKELREQGLIGLTLVVLGSGVLAATAALAEPPVPSAPTADVIRFLGLGLLATLMLAVTAGMVCGGAVFAAERESGTMAFLESLPSSRWGLWRAKLLAGVGLATIQSGSLVAVAGALGLVPTLGWALSITLCALLAFVWGLLGSTMSRTTLGSVGVAISAAVLTAFLVMLPLLVFFQAPGFTPIRPRGALIFLVCMFVVPVALSAWLYTTPDRLRAADGERGIGFAPVLSEGSSQRARSWPRIGISALLWMTLRQLRVPALVLSGFAGLFGLALLAPNTYPVLTWPSLALAAGVLTGVIAFGDEQTRGVWRFWGEQRLPLGRTWMVKIGVHLLFCLFLLVLMALPLVLAALFGGNRASRGHTPLANVFRSQIFDVIGRHGWKYLFVPAIYGFAAGHLCGLLFRKLVVACGVAAIIGGVGAMAWGPSLLAGGVSHWQVWAPPCVALLTARLLMPAWASDRLATRRSLETLAAGCVACFLVLATGIGYRILEIPNRPDGEDDIQYVNGLSPLDDNAGRREFRTAADRYARSVAIIAPEFDRADRPPTGGGRRLRIDERLDQVPRLGWPVADPELGMWLDRVMVASPEPEEGPWPALAASATKHPNGVFEYPQLVGVVPSRESTLENARRMSIALLARGLQRQAAGDPEAFLSFLRTTIALSRTMRTGSIINAYTTGAEIERTALLALDRWLEEPPMVRILQTVLAPFPEASVFARVWSQQVSPSPALLRATLEVLEANETTEPFDPTPHYLAERYVLREAQKSPSQWLPLLLTPPGETPERVTHEVELIGISWAVPWERERTRRLVGLGYEMGQPSDRPAEADPRFVVGRPGEALLIRPRFPSELPEAERMLRSIRRAAILKLALRLFKAERGRYPEALAELTEAGYLHQLPTDPHDETHGFGYRVVGAGGETLRAPSRPSGLPGSAGDNIVTRFIPAGQAIIWSVGPDKLDQGGKSLPIGGPNGFTRPDDLVYIVPFGPES